MNHIVTHEKLYKEISDFMALRQDYGNEIVWHIKNLLALSDNKRIDFEGDDMPTINHLHEGAILYDEFSCVKCVYLKNGEVYYDCEDGDEEPITQRTFDELWDIYLCCHTNQ